jgi:glutamate dehydrogenase (NAD(P)+)
MGSLGLVIEGATVAIQGFGKVGGSAARFFAEAGLKVVAVSDQYGAIYRQTGLDVHALQRYVGETGSVTGFPASERLDCPSDLLLLDLDLLVPAATEGVVHAGNAPDVRARLIVEGANGPVTREADTILADSNTLVVPDILANAGGVVVSYFEWVQASQAFWWSADEVDGRLRQRMTGAWEKVANHADESGLSLRQAATCIAVDSVVQAHLARGLFP